MFDGLFTYGDIGKWLWGRGDEGFSGTGYLHYGENTGHCAKEDSSKDGEESQNIHPIPEGSKVSDQKTQGRTLPPKPNQISWN